MQLLNETKSTITPLSSEWKEKATKRLSELLMPYWALGKVMDYAAEIAGMLETTEPDISRRASLLFGADHGIVNSGVSPCPQGLTNFMMRQFPNGGPAISTLSKYIGADLYVTDVGTIGDLSDMVTEGKIIDKKVAEGTKDFSKEPAMSREEAIASIEAGIEVVQTIEDKYNLFVIGEMGIGNTTPSSAIVSLYTGITPDVATGCGAGLDEEGRQKKAKIIAQALELHSPDVSDPVDVLAKVGGFEIGAMAGAMLAAAACKKVIVLDGFICTAAALIAQAINPACTDYMLLGHRSMEPGHVAASDTLGKEPVLNLGFRLGEGSGAAMAVPVIESGVKLLTDMVTLSEAGVSLA